MKEKWAYVGLYTMVFLSVWDEVTVINSIVMIALIMRIAYERNHLLTVLIISSTVLLTISNIRLVELSKKQDIFIGQEVQCIVELPVNKLVIDGDLLTGYGKVFVNQQVMDTLVSYKIKTLAEKEQLQEITKDSYAQVEVVFNQPEHRRNKGTFDYADYLKSKKIFTTTTIKKIKKIYSKQGILAKLHQWRYQLVNNIRSANNGKITEYALALVFGERKEVNDEDINLFKELGIMHLLAISGLHITMIVEGILKGLWRIGITKESSYWILLCCLVVYGEMILWNISGTRAIGMMLLQIIWQKLTKQSLSTMDSLAMMVIITSIWNPYILYSSAFQLSYGMTFIVLIVTRGCYDAFQNQYLKTGITLLWICLLGLPLIVKYVYSYHLLALGISVVMTYLLAKVIMPMVIGYSIAVQVQLLWIINPLVKVFNYLMDWLLVLLTYCSQFSFLKGTFGVEKRYLWVIYYVVVIGLIFSLEHLGENKQKLTIALRGCCLMGILLLIPYQFERKVIYLDIGQGDATVIIDRGYNNNVLIDTGGTVALAKKDWQKRSKASSHAEKTIIPALKALGISRIKTVILTHADSDHIGNMVELNQHFTIDKVLIAKGMERHPQMVAIQQQMAKGKIQVIQAPLQLKEGTIKLNFLAPLHESMGDNKDSLVTLVDFANKKWLFLGDIDQQREKELLKHYPQLTTDILKIAHHGSNTSSHSQFLQKVDSQYALISCGKNNFYKHPSEKVINRIEEAQIPYARTDQVGAIEIIPKKDKVMVRKILVQEMDIITP